MKIEIQQEMQTLLLYAAAWGFVTTNILPQGDRK
jgi:hypothetical protein